MAELLHVFNGDSSFESFKDTDLEGDTVIWREMLCEGPVRKDLDDKFWKAREKFINESYADEEEYDQFVFSEIKKLENISDYKEIVLWFEFDLFCQVNMLGCLQIINHPNISLVCAGEEGEKGRLKGLGEIDPATYKGLFDQRIAISEEDIDFIAKVWTAYVSNDPEAIKVFAKDHSTFQYLGSALQAHLDNRFPDAHGLTQIDKEILGQMKKGARNEMNVVRYLLRWDKWLGFGDLQYFNMINNLDSLFEPDRFRLTPLGVAVADGKEPFKA